MCRSSRHPQVYVARSSAESSNPPVVIARDRLDVPIWVDDYAQSRFVLAGDIMRTWVIWDIFDSKTLLYVACADSLRPPRVVGMPYQLRDAVQNGDPARTVSRERIYLETSADAGAVGQCCLVFKSSAAKGKGDDQTCTHATESASTFEEKRSSEDASASKLKSQSDPQLAPSMTFLEAIKRPLPDDNDYPPATISPVLTMHTRPATSSERGTAELLGSARIMGFPSTAKKISTPRTADAISSLAHMQILAHHRAKSLDDISERSHSPFASPVRAGATTPRTMPPSTPLDTTLGQDRQQEALELLMSVNKRSSPEQQRQSSSKEHSPKDVKMRSSPEMELEDIFPEPMSNHMSLTEIHGC